MSSDETVNTGMADLPEPFHEVLRRVVMQAVESKNLTTKAIARRLGVRPGTFEHYLQTGEGNRHCPARIIPDLCLLLDDYELLDALEAAAGRIAFRPGTFEHLDPANIGATYGLLKEFSDAVSRLSETLRDGVVEKRELQQTVKELDDVIRESVKLKHWLEERQRSDAAKLKSQLRR
jgi:hypothetical protein